MRETCPLKYDGSLASTASARSIFSRSPALQFNICELSRGSRGCCFVPRRRQTRITWRIFANREIRDANTNVPSVSLVLVSMRRSR